MRDEKYRSKKQIFVQLIVLILLSYIIHERALLFLEGKTPTSCLLQKNSIFGGG